MESHYIRIDQRKRVVITQVTDVDAFDENVLWANLNEGSVEVAGTDLKIEKLDLNEGMLILNGNIDSVGYISGNKMKKSSFSFMRAAKK